jgi:tRNA A37 methylthiotransferase MiaB
VALFKKYKVLTGGFFIIGFPEETPETMEDQYIMMSELQLDRMGTMILIPFPGTEIFKQVIRDKLFVDDVDIDNLWKTPMSFAQNEFVIKPYNMTIEELHEYRTKLEGMRYKYSRKNLLLQK